MATHVRPMLLCFAVSVLFGPVIVVGDEPASFDTLATEYKRDIRPLLGRYDAAMRVLGEALKKNKSLKTLSLSCAVESAGGKSGGGR